jgi:hypothetical protein
MVTVGPVEVLESSNMTHLIPLSVTFNRSQNWQIPSQYTFAAEWRTSTVLKEYILPLLKNTLAQLDCAPSIVTLSLFMELCILDSSYSLSVQPSQHWSTKYFQFWVGPTSQKPLLLKLSQL